MPLFTLTKWYFDILDSEKRYVLFYVARASLAGRTQAFLNMSVARLGDERSDSACVFLGSRENFWSPGAVTMKYGEIRWTPETMTVRFDSRDLIAHLRYSRHPQDFSGESILVIPAPFRGRMVWTPASIRCLVDGEVSVSNRRYAFRKQDGYIDRLDSNVFPLLSPVRTLLWGRMHAITANTSMMLVINAEGRGFYWADPASGAPYHYSTRALPGDVRITSAPRRPLRFYQHGNAVPAGSYVITGDIGAIRIVVNPGGRIRIQRI